ncbi:putative CBF/NF-Y family transcription factor [Taphrina deformans PYCC 5710]|uniref:CBF/NF-Y family transcription factor n=1 Tax=Taphrina deformans (strain PYCC 5710 / ATCC 11124 / CBS 356.35 / IMI 108563 / JCM 9778 / NBRC 8474) TaxID=1097556 RepID=R4X8H4_TAPDE|nr:putative CBF/NF-Y family transcription factor [Taphrina deformans PYCC 5710]|eukprot:CCG81611.1 putative CBF/NF-Y family transcription factor [Taphrina deformans PYCC 5710]
MPSKSSSSAAKASTNGSKVSKALPPTGNKKLPLARVKKIAKMDEDVIALSNAAAIVIAGATEKFAAYFAEQSFFYTLADKKKVLDYKHCASAVARLPQLDFLSDVVPPTVRVADTAEYKKMEALKKREEAKEKGNGIPEWAKAHPEALAKMKAAQAERGDEDGEDLSEVEDMENDDPTASHATESVRHTGTPQGMTASVLPSSDDAEMSHDFSVEIAGKSPHD